MKFRWDYLFVSFVSALIAEWVVRPVVSTALTPTQLKVGSCYIAVKATEPWQTDIIIRVTRLGKEAYQRVFWQGHYWSTLEGDDYYSLSKRYIETTCPQGASK